MALQGKDLGALVGQMGMDTKQWDQAISRMQGGLMQMEVQAQSVAKRIGQAMDRAGRRMEMMGRTLTTRVTAPLAALGGLAVREFGNFDSAMTQSLAIMGDVSQAMRQEMTAAAREIGRTTAMSAQEAAESYFFLASAGLDAEQSIAALPQVAAFAQAGMFDMATATDLATDAQSALGLAVDDTEENLRNMARITDVLVKANTLANASVEQFSTALTREAGSALKSFNIDMEEGVAVLAAFADQGIKGEVAGSGLGRVLRLLTQAANNNAEEMQELGISVFDAEGNMRNLADIIADLENALEGMSDQQRTASLDAIGFTARVQQMILPLLGTSDAIRQYEKELRNAGGTTQEVADKQLQTFNQQLSLLWDNIKDVAIQFGETMVPALQRLVTWTRNAVDAFQEMEHEARVRIIGIAALLAASGPLLMALGKAARIIVAFAALAFSKFGLIVTAVTGVGVAATWVYENWEKVSKGLEVFMNMVHLAALDMARGVVKAVEWMISEVVTQLTPGGGLMRGLGLDFGDMFTGSLGFEEGLEELDNEWAQVFGRMMATAGEFNEMEFGSLRDALGSLKDSVMELTGANQVVEDFFALFEGSGFGVETAGKEIEEFSRQVVASNSVVQESYRETAERIGQAFLQIQEAGQKLPEALRGSAEEMINISDQLVVHIVAAIENMTEAFLQGVADMAFGVDGMSNLWHSLLSILADLAIRVGKIVMGAGIALDRLRNALLNPFTGGIGAIAAGAALIAIGAGVKAALRNAAQGSGGSGVTSQGPTARSVPQQNQEVVFRIGNNELIGSLQQAGVIDQRVGKRRNFGGS